ncbi:MAG: hypothetical protein ACHQK8_06250 [Bacteroidia bacterium]
MENFEEQFKKTVNDWRKNLEDLQVQFTLGKMDAAGIFEKQKDQFKTWLHSFREQMDKAVGITKENSDHLRAKFDELLVQLNLGKAESKDAFEEQKKKIEDAMNDLFETAKKIFGSGYDKMLGIFESYEHTFKTGLEILELQFALGKMESNDEIERIKKEINEKLDTINRNMQKLRELGKENMEEWSTLMKENYEKLKTFADWWAKQK